MDRSLLIVDDEPDNLKALHRLLKKSFDVTVCESAFDAVKLVQKNKYGVILSDQRMPEMTGVEFFEKTKSLSPLSSRVLITGYTDLDSVIEAINRGNVYRYISKPWDPEELKLTLNQAFEAYQLRANLEKANKDLKEAYDQLKTLDQAKEKFLYLVSHELKTPLTVLQSHGALLTQDAKKLADDHRKSVEAIEKATTRFSEIIDETLHFMQETANDSLQITSINWDTFLKSFTVPLKAKPKGSLQGDAKRLSLAFQKLFEVLGSSKGEVEIETNENECLIAYTGQSLEAEQFLPFVFSKPLLNHQKDLGLRLALFKTILDKHGAQITLEPYRIRVDFKDPRSPKVSS